MGKKWNPKKLSYMKENAKFIVVKPIPIRQSYNGYGKSEIPVSTVIYRTHGMYYMDGGLLPEDYQEDFDVLIENEEKNGWNYLRPEIFTEYGV